MSAAPDDVREFAEALTRLKERTDRSYGQLARRLGMNTSTLHRYCAGDTVPLDFAPVERFAALCGATGAERLELHRLWLPAVAARQRARTGGGGVEPGEQHSEPAESPKAHESAALVQAAESGESGEPMGSGEPIRSAGPVKSVGTAEPSESSAETAEPSPGAAEPGEPVAPSAGAVEPAEP
uniref:helix-turn-helix domain-containing protein n=1 Tax=Streptomyces caniscabiei TaxID=2746961 RepID=UPI000A76BA88